MLGKEAEAEGWIDQVRTYTQYNQHEARVLAIIWAYIRDSACARDNHINSWLALRDHADGCLRCSVLEVRIREELR